MTKKWTYFLLILYYELSASVLLLVSSQHRSLLLYLYRPDSCDGGEIPEDYTASQD